MELCTKEGIEQIELVERDLINAAQKRMLELKEKYPNKKLCMRCFCSEDDYEKQQQLLELGFEGHNFLWILKFDLAHTEIPKVEIPQNLSVDMLDNTEENLKAYLAANCLGYNNVQDAEGELRFRLCDDHTKIFVAKDCEKIVSSVTIWRITEERAATENFFTIPDYRRKKIGFATIAKVLTYLKEEGYKLATLTCLDNNVDAIALYTRIGYKVMGHLLEMHWDV